MFVFLSYRKTCLLLSTCVMCLALSIHLIAPIVHPFPKMLAEHIITTNKVRQQSCHRSSLFLLIQRHYTPYAILTCINIKEMDKLLLPQIVVLYKHQGRMENKLDIHGVYPKGEYFISCDCVHVKKKSIF